MMESWSAGATQQQHRHQRIGRAPGQNNRDPLGILSQSTIHSDIILLNLSDEMTVYHRLRISGESISDSLLAFCK